MLAIAAGAGLGVIAAILTFSAFSAAGVTCGNLLHPAAHGVTTACSAAADTRRAPAYLIACGGLLALMLGATAAAYGWYRASKLVVAD